MRPILSVVCTAILISACAGSRDGTTPNERAEIVARVNELINSKNYVFKAQTALPMRGRSFPLTSEYDIRVSKDSLIVWLPYFGRAYTAPIDPTQGGIQFTSTNFEYKATKKNRGGWEVFIKPNDAKGGEQFNLSIGAAGFGSLQVTSNNRQSISFTGQIAPGKGSNILMK